MGRGVGLQRKAVRLCIQFGEVSFDVICSRAWEIIMRKFKLHLARGLEACGVAEERRHVPGFFWVLVEVAAIAVAISEKRLAPHRSGC